MLSSLFNYLKVDRKKNEIQIIIGLTVFYLFPYLILNFFLSFSVINTLSTAFGYDVFILVVFMIFAYLLISLIAALNIAYGKNLYSNENTLAKKVFLTFFYAFPFSVIAHYFYYIVKNIRKTINNDRVLLISYILSLVFMLVIAYVNSTIESEIMKSQFNYKDYSLNAFNKINIVIYKDELVGHKYKLKIPMMLMSGFPKENRRNSQSLNKADYLLLNLKNSCINCLSHERIEGNLKAYLVPIQTEIEVVGSFLNENNKYLLIKTADNKIAEVARLGFENEVIDPHIFLNEDFDDAIFHLINEYQSQNSVNISICNEDDNNTIQNLRLFIKDFKLESEMEIVKYYKTQECIWCKFNTINSLLLFNYYRKDWKVYGRLSDPYSEEFYDEKLEKFNYEEFIK